MSKVIAVINQKGGVGKTATAVNLAVELSVHGKKTLLIDFDPSGNASRGLVSHIDELDVLTIGDLIMDKKLDPFTVIIPSTIHGREMPNLHIIPSKISLAKIQRDLIPLSFKEIRLSLQVTKIKHLFDYIIIDCSPTLTEFTINAIVASDFFLIPITYEKNSIEGVGDLFEIMQELKGGDDYDYRILRNKFDARRRVANNYVDHRLAPFIEKGVVFNTVIPQDEEINKSSIAYQPLLTFCPHAKAAQYYTALMQEVLDHE